MEKIEMTAKRARRPGEVLARWLGLLGTGLMLAMFVSGCSGCDESSRCPDVPCEEGQICFQGYCLDPDEGCTPACGSGQTCVNGVCVGAMGQCSVAGQSCDPRRVAGQDYLCIDWGGADGQGARCTTSCVTAGCEEGSLCFLLSWGPAPSCATDSQCRAGEVCSGGNCYTAACRPSECAGTGLGDARCDAHHQGQAGFEAGAKCHEVGNGASYCFPAGRGGENDSCMDFVTAYNAGQLDRTCMSGLMCVAGECRRGCTETSDCRGDEACIGGGPTTMGFCGPSCTPFESGSCGPGQTCFPVTPSEGYCRPAGERDVFERCEPGAGQCADGLICVTYQATPGQEEARCQHMCNVAVAPAGADGRVSPAAQTLRDQSCPQPAERPVYASFVHLARSAGPVDFYIDGRLVDDQPARFEARVAPGGASPDHGFGEIDPGTRRLAVRTAGAPTTDAPLAEAVVVTSRGEHYLWVLVPVPGGTAEAVELVSYDVTELAARALQGASFVHAIPDLAAVDLFALSAGTAWSREAATALALDLGPGQASAFSIGLEAPMDIYVFAVSEPEPSPDTARLIFRDVATIGEPTFWMLRGTLDPDDLNDTAALTALPAEFPASAADDEAVFTCIDSGNGIYGHCQQRCVGPSAYGSGLCRGESMGCAPIWRNELLEWQHGCVPVGPAASGVPCDPRATYGQCGEGLYCLEYGNAAPHYTATGLRGLCTPLCSDADAGSDVLVCDDGQICGPWSYTESFDVGRCGYPCDPGTGYADVSCPSGLQSCLPVSTLEDDPVAPGLAPPIVVVQEPLCSSSGSLAAGQGCAGLDCEAGTECLFPRSRQSDFVSTVLSQYFGGAGLRPVCTPQCDPFGTGRAAHRCQDGETCLFNYPLSADVGHCAPIVEERPILGACERPGESCGEDAICVINGGQNICFRFCQYLGAGSQGGFGRSSCPSGYQCAPFVQDIGYCILP
jgi:hypothetical protein